MIINGASRSNGAFFSRHLMRADQNERVTVREMRGFAYAEDVPSAFRELKERAEGTACKNHFYHANINTRSDETLTPEQWARAVDVLERELGLDGQPRFIVEHEKEGRTHQHVVWSRIAVEEGEQPGDVRLRAVSDSHNYRRHELAAREIEEAFGLSRVDSTLTRDKDATPRPERCPEDWESFRAQESRIDPKAMRAELTELWQRADSGPAFAAALEERGYVLARGDRRDFCVIDQAGDEHSLGRRISGVKAAEIRERMGGIDLATLPSVEEGRALARQRQEEAPQGSGGTTQAAEPVTASEAVPAATAAPVQAQPDARPAGPSPAFAEVLAETVQRAREEDRRDAEEEARAPGSRYARFTAWIGSVREAVAGWGQQVQDYWSGYFRRGEPEEAEPTPPPQPGMEPQP